MQKLISPLQFTRALKCSYFSSSSKLSDRSVLQKASVKLILILLCQHILRTLPRQWLELGLWGKESTDRMEDGFFLADGEANF